MYSRQAVFAFAGIILFFQGMPNAALNISMVPLILRVTPREFTGRVWAFIPPIMNVARLIAAPIGGYFVSTVFYMLHISILGIMFGPFDTMITLSGLITLIAGIYAMWQFTHQKNRDVARQSAQRLA